jgi:hypothetical protein
MSNEWYKNIPPQGVLCKTNGYSNDYAVIVNLSEEDFIDVYDGECISKSGDVYLISDLTPLTAQEITQFLPDSGLKIDVLLRSYGFTIDVDGQLCGLVAGDMGYEDTGIFVDDYCKKAINGEYTTKEWLDLAPWQGMETAPRDGSYFAAINEKHGLCNAYYDDEESCFITAFSRELYDFKWLPLPKAG